MAKTFSKFADTPKKKLKLPRVETSEPTEYASSDGVACPGILQLAPPFGFPPEILDPDAKFDQVVLGIALACNDLHDCLWVLSITERGKPKAARLDGYDGGRMGLELWATRVLVGVLNELVTSISKNHSLLTSHEDIPAVRKTMTSAALAAWDNVVNLALSDGSENGDRRFLNDVRHNLSHHYYQPKRLAQGYKRLFFENPKEPRTLFAYLSEGERVKDTRFYFIDAAAQTATDIANEAPSAYHREQRLVELASTVGGSCFAFVTGLIHVRVAKA